MTLLATYGLCDRCGECGPLTAHAGPQDGPLVALCASCDAETWAMLVAAVAVQLDALA